MPTKPGSPVERNISGAALPMTVQPGESPGTDWHNPGLRNREYQYESMMHRTGVKSVILRRLFPWIERIGHRFRRRVPAMLNEGIKQKLSEPQASSFAAPQWASGWSARNQALIFCYFGIKAKVEIENDI